MKDRLAQLLRCPNSHFLFEQWNLLSVDELYDRVLGTVPSQSIQLKHAQLSWQLLMLHFLLFDFHVFDDRVEVHTRKIIIKLQFLSHLLFEGK